MFKDHLVLDLQDLSYSGFGGALIHGISDSNVGVGKPHGVEVNALVLGFSAGFLSCYQIGEVGVNVGVVKFPLLVHSAERLGSMFDGFPVIAHDFGTATGYRVVVFPTADVAVKEARFEPFGFEERRLRAGGGDDDVGVFYGGGKLCFCGNEFKIGQDWGHFGDELLFFFGQFGGHAAVFQGGNGGFHGDEVHFRLFAGADEADGSRVFAGEMPRRKAADGADSHVGAERSFHERDGESVLNFGKQDDGGQVLHPVSGGVERKYGNPFDAANPFFFEGCGQAVDSLLGFVVKNLHDFFGEQDVSRFEFFKSVAGGVDGHFEVETTGAQQVFLGEVTALDLMIRHRPIMPATGAQSQLNFAAGLAFWMIFLSLKLVLAGGFPLYECRNFERDRGRKL